MVFYQTKGSQEQAKMQPALDHQSFLIIFGESNISFTTNGTA
jgi:hypothetical protein